MMSALLSSCLLEFHAVLHVPAGKMVYHGPREDILPFFETQGMHCPARKADSDFLQEVTSRKDQQVSGCLHLLHPATYTNLTFKGLVCPKCCTASN